MHQTLDISSLPGLSDEEANRRLQAEGFNELPSSQNHNLLTMAWEVVREPMFLLLLACGVVYLLLDEPQEAAMLLGFVFVVMGITLYQERKTERALEALRDLSSSQALVNPARRHRSQKTSEKGTRDIGSSQFVSSAWKSEAEVQARDRLRIG